jgi:hypothetical protein
MRKTATEGDVSYPAYGSYGGGGGYTPGIDDPTQLSPQFYSPPEWDPYAWPKWALPTGLIAGGVLGAVGLRAMLRRGAGGVGRVVTAAVQDPPVRTLLPSGDHAALLLKLGALIRR